LRELKQTLRARIAPELLDRMRGEVSFPFEPVEHQRIAVKVNNFRGNEVVRVVPWS
jgi:adenine-specific DNA-methyltransferase